jgi:hypothetical protein
MLLTSIDEGRRTKDEWLALAFVGHSSLVVRRSIIRPNKNRSTSDLEKRLVSPARSYKQSSTKPMAGRLALLELFRV